MNNEAHLTGFGAPKYDVEASIAALLHWEPLMPLSDLSQKVEQQLNYASPETRKRYRRAIVGTLIPNDGVRTSEVNSLALLVKMVEERKARLEAIFYHILKRNKALMEICLSLGNQFTNAHIDRRVIRQLFIGMSEKAAYETVKKAFRILRDFGLVQRQPEERIMWRSPCTESLAYILYDYYTSVGAIAPDLREIENNDYLRASFFHRTGILEAIQQGNDIWWVRERRPPIDRIVFRYASLAEFLDSLVRTRKVYRS